MKPDCLYFKGHIFLFQIISLIMFLCDLKLMSCEEIKCNIVGVYV